MESNGSEVCDFTELYQGRTVGRRSRAHLEVRALRRSWMRRAVLVILGALLAVGYPEIQRLFQ